MPLKQQKTPLRQIRHRDKSNLNFIMAAATKAHKVEGIAMLTVLSSYYNQSLCCSVPLQSVLSESVLLQPVKPVLLFVYLFILFVSFTEVRI